jgi:hypothetical protein
MCDRTLTTEKAYRLLARHLKAHGYQRRKRMRYNANDWSSASRVCVPFAFTDLLFQSNRV